MKGQLFSMDFLVAVTLVTLALGITLQGLEFSQRGMALRAELANGTAEAIAGAIADNVSGAVTCAAPSCCVAFSNGTSSCGSLSCPRDVLTARRLMMCGGSACSVEVRACG